MFKQTPGFAPGISGLQPLALLLGYACVTKDRQAVMTSPQGVTLLLGYTYI